MDAEHQRALEQLRAAREEGRSRVAITDLTRQEAAWAVVVTDPISGKELRGTFTSRMPALKERTLIDLLAAQLVGGVAWHSVPPETQSRVRMMAEFTVLLTDRPAWFADPESFYTNDVPVAVYAKIVEHWSTFFRCSRSPGGGPPTGQGPGAPAAQDLG